MNRNTKNLKSITNLSVLNNDFEDLKTKNSHTLFQRKNRDKNNKFLNYMIDEWFNHNEWYDYDEWFVESQNDEIYSEANKNYDLYLQSIEEQKISNYVIDDTDYGDTDYDYMDYIDC
jgi:hypothetical protein